jgi:hypothetical protein
VVDPHCREHLGRALGLIGLDPHLIAGHFLVVFLAKDGYDVEGRTPGECGGHELDWLRSRPSSRIVQQQIVAASGLRHKLALLFKRLSQFDFGGNHDSAPAVTVDWHRNKCREPDFVTGNFLSLRLWL